MSQGTLINHRGAVEIDRLELSRIEAPSPTETWFPLKHSTVLETVEDTLGSSGFAVAKAQLAVSHQDKRFFGVLDSLQRHPPREERRVNRTGESQAPEQSEAFSTRQAALHDT